MDLAMAWVELRWSKRLLSVVEGIAGLKNSPSSELTFLELLKLLVLSPGCCFITSLLRLLILFLKLPLFFQFDHLRLMLAVVLLVLLLFCSCLLFCYSCSSLSFSFVFNQFSSSFIKFSHCSGFSDVRYRALIWKRKKLKIFVYF